MKKNKSYRFVAILLVYISSALAELFSVLLYLVSARVRTFLSKRKYSETDLAQIKQKREAKKNCVVFYCSSAGEYEQARPIANELVSIGFYVHILFFSESGFTFASLRNETIPFSLAPLDTLSNWRKLLSVLNPDLVLVVRHELWPCFLFESSKKATVFLINASLKSKKFVSLFAKKQLLTFVDRIFTVSEMEKRILCEALSLSENFVSVTGDSKYDRVLERVKTLENSPRNFPELSQVKHKFILGSAWREDCEIVLDAFARYKLENKDTLQIVIAPHQPKPEFLNWVETSCEILQMSFKRLSRSKEDIRDVDLVIVDSIGLLFDLYSACDLAFVGGASHHEVHNVLEPAAFGLTLAFGPRFKNSHEAVEIVSKNLAQVVRTREDCLKWMSSTLERGGFHKELQEFVRSKGGATQKILDEINVVISTKSER